MFRHLKVGDIATRSFCGLQQWKVTGVSDTLVTIGMGWTFDRDTGIEVDEDCPSISSCSKLVKEN
jgi:hypothetical protein